MYIKSLRSIQTSVKYQQTFLKLTIFLSIMHPKMCLKFDMMIQLSETLLFHLVFNVLK